MPRLIVSVLGAALGLPLLVYAAVGSFARYTADDYCWAGVLRTEGFFQGQLDWYLNYSPRYAFTFVVNLVELAGPAIVPALPVAAILVWLATLTWTFIQFGLTATPALLLAEVAAFATLQTAPDLPQSLYWQTGMLTYLLPLVLATFVIGWIRRAITLTNRGGRVSFGGLGLCALVTFMAGGLSETYLIPQNVALTLALVTCAALVARNEVGWGEGERGISGRTEGARGESSRGVGGWGEGARSEGARSESRRSEGAPSEGGRGERRGGTWDQPPSVALAYLAAALAGGVAALVVIVLAPATTSRVGGSPADLWLASSAAIATAAFQVLRLVRYFPLTILLCLVLPAIVGPPMSIVGPPTSTVSRRTFLLVTAGVAITVPFCYFPSFYAQNGNPPARSLIVPGALLIGYLLFCGQTLNALVTRLPGLLPMVAAAVLAFVPIGVAALSLPDLASAAQHAALWDAEDQQIRASRDAGLADLSVPPLPVYLGENFITTDRQDWFNVCVARYYGVRSIAATS